MWAFLDTAFQDCRQALLDKAFRDCGPHDEIRALQRLLPGHRVLVLADPDRGSRPLIIASDGRLDASAPASIATLIIDPESGDRAAFLARIPEGFINRWSHKAQHIAHVEQAALVMVIIDDCYPLQGRDAFWFIDNSVTLSAMIKGSSSEVDLARRQHCIEHWRRSAAGCGLNKSNPRATGQTSQAVCYGTVPS